MRLRPATITDAAFLYQLRCDPEYAAQSFSDPPASLAAHTRWLRGALHSSYLQQWIVEDDDGHPLGMVRVNGFPTPPEVSVALVADARGQGIGTAVLGLVQQHYPTLRARIKVGNAASRRAFAKAGFRDVAVEVAWP